MKESLDEILVGKDDAQEGKGSTNELDTNKTIL